MESISGGYDIPKGTDIFINHFALHHDPKEWENPEQFNPERFLEADGTSKAKPKAWLPFSAGRRACLAEKIAKTEIFMIWVGILQKFKITLPDGETPLMKQRSIPASPYPYKIKIEERYM